MAVAAPGGGAVVRAVLPRRSRLARSECDRHRGEDAAAIEQVLAANLDWVIVGGEGNAGRERVRGGKK